jgi:hypothetical protein
VAASEMLLPFHDFRADMCGLNQLGFQVVHNLRQRYLASIDATTFRVVELTSAPCGAVFLTDQNSHYDGSGPLWVKFGCFSPTFKHFVWPGTSPPKTSVTNFCYQNGVETSGYAKETWWIKGEPRTLLVQAAKLPHIPESPDYAKVVALLLPSSFDTTKDCFY